MRLWVAPVVVATATVFVAPQAPGGAWALVASEDGEIRTLYFDLFRQSETWLKIVPLFEESGPNPTTLYFSITYPGKNLTATPAVVRLRAQSNLRVYPMTLRTPTLTLRLDGADRLDLTARGYGHWLNYPCDECAFDGIVTNVPLLTFFRILEARVVDGTALGFPFRLGEAHLSALQEFLRHLVPDPSHTR